MEIVFNAQSTMTVKAVHVKVEVAVLSRLPVPNSPCGLCGRKATFQEVKDESIYINYACYVYVIDTSMCYDLYGVVSHSLFMQSSPHHLRATMTHGSEK